MFLTVFDMFLPCPKSQKVRYSLEISEFCAFSQSDVFLPRFFDEFPMIFLFLVRILALISIFRVKRISWPDGVRFFDHVNIALRQFRLFYMQIFSAGMEDSDCQIVLERPIRSRDRSSQVVHRSDGSRVEAPSPKVPVILCGNSTLVTVIERRNCDGHYKEVLHALFHTLNFGGWPQIKKIV